MSKTSVTVFLCDGKDCRKAWRRVCDGAPGKWLKSQIEEAGLPYKLHIVKTECMDRCEHAASVCCVHGASALLQENIRSSDDADCFLAALRCCVEAGGSSGSAKPRETQPLLNEGEPEIIRRERKT